jgi:hypothetical protein
LVLVLGGGGGGGGEGGWEGLGDDVWTMCGHEERGSRFPLRGNQWVLGERVGRRVSLSLYRHIQTREG